MKQKKTLCSVWEVRATGQALVIVGKMRATRKLAAQTIGVDGKTLRGKEEMWTVERLSNLPPSEDYL